MHMMRQLPKPPAGCLLQKMTHHSSRSSQLWPFLLSLSPFNSMECLPNPMIMPPGWSTYDWQLLKQTPLQLLKQPLTRAGLDLQGFSPSGNHLGEMSPAWVSRPARTLPGA